MKNKYQYIICSVFLVMLAMACKKDNYSQPSSFLSGRLVYKGDSIGVERNQVPFQIYQYGFGKVGAINGTFAQDGSFSEVLFDGTYKLVIANGQGPFILNKLANGDPDSLTVTLKGSQTQDIEVTPYYMIRNAKITGAGGSDTTITANFSVEQVITDPALAQPIERVSLYVNKTQFASGGDNIAAVDLAGSSISDLSNISLQVNVSTTTPVQSVFYARVGLKIAGVEDLIFSPLVKIQL